MCLYPQLIKNRKYTENKKNGGTLPTVLDERTLYVPIGCQRCMECKKQKAREWTVRLQEDIRENKNGKFITLTLSNESYTQLNKEIPDKIIKTTKKWDGTEHHKEIIINGYKRDNAIATLSIRRFLERWRKQHKKSIRHWLCTELGHNGTENIHMHGIIWTDKTYDEIEDKWQYGFIWPRKNINKRGLLIRQDTYVNDRTINYITKYIYKTDDEHTTYNSKILSSNGIGNNYTKRFDSRNNIFKGKDTNETYKTRNGQKIALPIYYRNKIYNDEEKEKLWIHKLNKEERWILGNKINISKNEKEYYKALTEAQKLNTELGYGNNIKDWNRAKYEEERREMMQKKRIQNTNKDG